MSRLEIRQGRDYFGDKYLEVVETEPDTIAETIYSIVAATLQAPIIKAFNEHIEACDICSPYLYAVCRDGQNIANMISKKGMVAYG